MPAIRVHLICALAISVASSTVQAQQVAPSAEEQRDQLNREQAAFARHQLEENAASRSAYEEAVQARRAAIEREQAAYARRQDAYEAEKVRLAQEHEEAMARWRADVAACKAGHRDHCAPK